ncbi:unnamed protein product [Taenia asiatica]|uniref:RRM domain-containing protein n=1 Tax=Taenia asiatica TaxID=60517 RepID=A0A0R3VVL2_TAEAS|nr:unnamed protein product [Taenia asiatica]
MRSPSIERKASANGGNRSRSRSRSHSPRRVKVTSRRVVIANIPYHVTWNKLKQIFRDQLGFTGYLRLMKSNGRPNGMGLMEFKSIEGAEKAIEKMHRFEIGDRRIIVREETLRDQERMASMEFDGPSNPSIDVGGGMMPPNAGPGMPPQPRGSAGAAVPGVANLTPTVLEGMGVRGPITDSLYISNLDYGVDWRKIKDIFKIAGRVIHASVKQDDEGRSKGVAVVRFEHPYEALLAWSMLNGQTINDRPIRVKIDRDGSHAPPHLPIFPPTPQGAAAVASFMAHFNSNNNNSNSNNNIGGGNPGISYGGGGGGAFMPPPPPPPPPHQQSQLQPPSHQPLPQSQQPQQASGAAPSIAAAMAALIGGSGAGGGMGPGRGMPPPPHQEIIGSLLGAASAAGGGGGGGFQPMTGGAAGGMNQLGQIMGGYNSASDRPRDPNATIQQLLMAAAAGGMSQDQIAQAVSALGLNRDALGMPPYSGMGGMVNSQVANSDPYGGERGAVDIQSRRPPNYDSRSRFRGEVGGSRGYRHQQMTGGGGDVSRQPGSRGAGSMNRPDSDRMYIRRVSGLIYSQ